MSIRVIGSDDGFIDDRFYCTGKGSIGDLQLDFPNVETAIAAANELQERYPDTSYKVIEDTEEITKQSIDALWYNPKFIHLREIEDNWTDDGEFEENWGVR
jgi:hypothetical protein